jgi:catechol 2,3-dioxygenase-like lactoylglutathione lyase family enzyme
MNAPVSLAGSSIARLGKIIQLAFVPADMEAALAFWTQTIGAGPFFALEHIQMESPRYRGAPLDIDFSIMMGYWGDIQIELIQQHNDTPSIYTTWLREGRQGLHHVCIVANDMAYARQVCAEAGATVEQEAILPGGGEVIYVDTGGGPGTLVEIVKPPEGLLAAFEMFREAARNWDGSNPVRRLG